MPRKKRRRAAPRCKVCGRTGHNTRTCVYKEKKSLSPEKNKKESFSSLLQKRHEETTQTAKQCTPPNNSTKNKSVPVKVGQEVFESPHLINLKNEHSNDDAWKEVEVYKEAEPKKKQAISLDFAQMIQDANDDERQGTSDISIQKKRNINSREDLVMKRINQFRIELEVLEGRVNSARLKADKFPKEKNENISVSQESEDKNEAFFVPEDLPPEQSNGIDSDEEEKNICLSEDKDEQIFIEPEKKNIEIQDKSVDNQVSINKKKSLLGTISDGFSFNRFAVTVIIFIIIIGLPFPVIGYYNKIKKDTELIISESTVAFKSLQSSTMATFNSELDRAQSDLNVALNSFDKVNSIVDKEYKIMMDVMEFIPIFGDKVTSGKYLLSAGEHLTLGNSLLVAGINEATSDSDIDFTDRIQILQDNLLSAMPQFESAEEDLVKVDSDSIPEDYREVFVRFREIYSIFMNDLEDLEDLTEALILLLGDDHLRRYLIVFQNNHELRATGGFMGSFAIVDVQKGKLMNIEVPGGGTYDLKGQLKKYVKPPLALQFTNSRWEFQDANWFPDFSASADKIEWFYRHARNRTVDGVIAINASVLERVLQVIGPIENEKFDVVIDEKDALVKLQKEVEIDYDKQKNTPKEILGDILGQIIESMGNMRPDQFASLLTGLYEAAGSKEIQVHMNDEIIQDRFREFGWTGEIKNTRDDHDYLLVVNTNIQGQKTDAKIIQTIEHQAVVQEDGSIIDTVFIKRRHKGQPNELFYGGINLNYMRVYVPKGAELIEAGGFTYPPEDAFHVPEDFYEEDEDLLRIERYIDTDPISGTRITSEFDKTVFSNWVVVSPGEIVETFFTYKLPFNAFEVGNFELASEEDSAWKKLLVPEKKVTSHYNLFIQKQSGINSEFEGSIIYPKDWKPLWKSDTDIELAINGSSINKKLNKDTFMGIVMERELSP